MSTLSLSGGVLSQSTNGQPVTVGAGWTSIHVVGSGTTGWDEVWLFVSNIDSAAHQLTIGWGGQTSPGNILCASLSIPANSAPVAIVKGISLNNGLTIYAKADAANVINLTGHYRRAS